ncbi:MAG: cytochrome [Acidimicrobiales bacterium]|nr:cytochrome [Acidimicrobiales bacterium]
MTGTAAPGAVQPFDPFELQDTILGDIRDPFPALAKARRRGAVEAAPPDLFDDDSGIEIAPGADCFTAYSHKAVTTVLRDAEAFSSEILGDVVGDTILQMAGEEHRRHRALVSHAFRQKALARWEDELVRAVVDALIDRVVDAGRAELVRDLTFNFPVQVIARILGLPQRDFPRFQRWSIEMLSSIVNPERGLAAARALDAYFGTILEDRRRQPRDDLISDLATAEFDGERLSDEEVFGFLRILLPAGVETTYRSSGNLLYALLNHPEQLEAIAGNRALISQAIEEGLRWEPPILFLLRNCIRDTEVCGTTIAEGAVINVCIGAANRDDARYVEPDRFDIFREPRQHVTFGWGPHMCLGMHLARMETRVALGALLDRLPELHLDPDFEPPFVQGSAFRSPPELHVRFSTR